LRTPTISRIIQEEEEEEIDEPTTPRIPPKKRRTQVRKAFIDDQCGVQR
jgi:hypothetical protein